MSDGVSKTEREQALAELKQRLRTAEARSRLTKAQVESVAEVGKTTVWKALHEPGSVPSQKTVMGLARAFKLPEDELLDLLAMAAGQPTGITAPTARGVGRPIGHWEPHELEVHPAGRGEAIPGLATSGGRALPSYVTRVHDRVLADAVQHAEAGHSRIVVLVGTSSTGKTRACWEAVQPLATRGWRLWHPFEPTRAEAVLAELGQVVPRTVVWLNEAQHYLGDSASGERIAAAVHRLLVDEERGPVLVLGTLWPEYARRFTTLPTPDQVDPHSRVRELLATCTVTVPDAFDARALAAAAALAKQGDRLLADALTRALDSGRLTQDLAGAPELLRCYEQATPPARALLDAAMDARRLGVGLYLSQIFLTDAATDYLSQSDYDRLTADNGLLADDWAESAYAELAELVHGKQAPLPRTAPRPPRRPPASPSEARSVPAPPTPGYRLADYLDQHGRTTRRSLCPPDSFWHAAYTHLTHRDDLESLTRAADGRYRLQWAHHLHHRATHFGSTKALRAIESAGRHGKLPEKIRGRPGPLAVLREAADHDDTEALYRLAILWQEAWEKSGDGGRPAAPAGNLAGRLGFNTQDLSPRATALAVAQQAVKWEILRDRERTRGRDWSDVPPDYVERVAPRVLRGAVAAKDGDREKAELYLGSAADLGNTFARYLLVTLREADGDRQGADDFAWQVPGGNNLYSVYRLAVLREENGNRRDAEDLVRRVAPFDDAYALCQLILLRTERGDRKGAEDLASQSVAEGDASEGLLPQALSKLWPYGLNPDGTPTPPWQA
ncbi:hypothetical protein ACFQ77_06650 [Streptomyces virginiae]|uniref:hypothetical protein n=1 Tax=Streptomyces virginiae TaxID=1961 RepID=UPI00367B341F